MYFNFTNPVYLFLLFLIPVLIFFHFYSLKNIRKRAVSFANFEAIARVKGIDLYSKNIIILVLNILMVFFLVFALSGLTLYKEMDSSSFSFVIAIDASESMGANDMTPSRLDVAKKTSIDFIKTLPLNSDIGIISFAGNSFVEKDLTNNKAELEVAVNGVELTRFGGTDLYEAISISSNLLKSVDNKAVILMSDGQINVDDIVNVIEYAREQGMIVHTFGIGSVEGGRTSYGISKLDEDSLRSLAYSTSGRYFSVGNEKEMVNAFEEIAPLTRKIGKINLSVYLIFLVIVLFVVEKFLVEVSRIHV